MSEIEDLKIELVTLIKKSEEGVFKALKNTANLVTSENEKKIKMLEQKLLYMME
jgi:hypothetical protein